MRNDGNKRRVEILFGQIFGCLVDDYPVFTKKLASGTREKVGKRVKEMEIGSRENYFARNNLYLRDRDR